jgi:hypothetical protein
MKLEKMVSFTGSLVLGGDLSLFLSPLSLSLSLSLPLQRYLQIRLLYIAAGSQEQAL